MPWSSSTGRRCCWTAGCSSTWKTPASDRRTTVTIGQKIAAGYVLALGVLVVIGGLAYWSTSTLISNNARVEHTYKVLKGLEEYLSLVKSAETGQRGYLLTGKQPYLEPHRSARG